MTVLIPSPEDSQSDVEEVLLINQSKLAGEGNVSAI